MLNELQTWLLLNTSPQGSPEFFEIHMRGIRILSHPSSSTSAVYPHKWLRMRSCLSSLRVERIAGERQDASTAAVRIGCIATSGHALANTIRSTRASDDLQDQQWGISVVACVGVLSTGHSVGCQVDPGYENSEEQPRITRSFLNGTRKLGAELLSRDICKHLLAPHAC
jgi:hypothetical protein